MIYALDANIVIYLFKGLGNVVPKLLVQSPSDIAIPAVALYELEVGVAMSNAPERRRRQLEALRTTVRILPFDADAAAAASILSAHLHRAGKPIGPLDTLIAGTALASGATLVTRNLAEFRRVPGLKVVNWY